jgi:anthranilate phosphoribosyltransferase
VKGRLGFGSFVEALARLLKPFECGALQVVAPNEVTGHDVLQGYLSATGSRALLLEGVEGEAFADPRRRPKIEFLAGGESLTLFDAESPAHRPSFSLPPAIDAHSVAGWIRSALAGEVPLPLPLVNQIACCLFGAGYADDINQAKAIVAIETGSLAAVSIFCSRPRFRRQCQRHCRSR